MAGELDPGGFRLGPVRALAAVEDISRKTNEVRVAISTSTPDRHGEIVDASGWLFADYKKNPVVFFGHESWGLPIGRALPDSIEIKGDRLLATNRLAVDLPFTSPWGEFIHDTGLLILNGDISAVSAGFAVMRWRDVEGREYERSHGDDHPRMKKGQSILAADLWEQSFVGIPANPDAGVTDAGSESIVCKMVAHHFEILARTHPGPVVGPPLLTEKNAAGDEFVLDILKTMDRDMRQKQGSEPPTRNAWSFLMTTGTGGKSCA